MRVVSALARVKARTVLYTAGLGTMLHGLITYPIFEYIYFQKVSDVIALSVPGVLEVVFRASTNLTIPLWTIAAGLLFYFGYKSK